MNLEVNEESRSGVDFIVGKHVYGSLYGLKPEIADDEELIRQTVLDAVKAANATLIQLMSWKIPGIKGGVSVMALLMKAT
jgi:arginine decarboxylase (EC 4.1.1.19)